MDCNPSNSQDTGQFTLHRIEVCNVLEHAGRINCVEAAVWERQGVSVVVHDRVILRLADARSRDVDCCYFEAALVQSAGLPAVAGSQFQDGATLRKEANSEVQFLVTEGMGRLSRHRTAFAQAKP
jgi:hypothetical protein